MKWVYIEDHFYCGDEEFKCDHCYEKEVSK